MQAALLLTRRYRSHTEATADLAMMLMVISGLVALTQSLIILLTGAKWMLREDFTPCVEQACGLLECTKHKDRLGLPNVNYNFEPFSFQLTGVPRTVLHMLAGGHLEFLFRSPVRHSPQGLLLQCASVLMIWEHSIRFVVNMEGMWNSWRGMKDQRKRRLRYRTDGEEPMSRLNARAVVKRTIDFVVLIFGLGVGAVGLGSMVLGLLYLVFPFIYLHASIIEETSAWRTKTASAPCPELWKDDLEDVLWWF